MCKAFSKSRLKISKENWFDPAICNGENPEKLLPDHIVSRTGNIKYFELSAVIMAAERA